MIWSHDLRVMKVWPKIFGALIFFLSLSFSAHSNNSYENWLQQFVNFIINPEHFGKAKNTAHSNFRVSSIRSMILNFMVRQPPERTHTHTQQPKDLWTKLSVA